MKKCISYWSLPGGPEGTCPVKDAVAAAKEHFGETGLFLVASLSGLTDVDAITLSTAQLIQSGHVSTDTGWRMILTGISRKRRSPTS